MSAIEHLSLEDQVEALRSIVAERDRRHGEQIEQLTDRLSALEESAHLAFDTIRLIGDGMRSVEIGQRDLVAELVSRRQLDERRTSFAVKWFDAAKVREVLLPLRDSDRVVDADYVRTALGDLKRKKKIKGETLRRLLEAMGLDEFDVDEALQGAEIGS